MNDTSDKAMARDVARQLYTEAQQWTRHYEALLVNANVFIITISLAFVGISFSDKAGTVERIVAMSVPIVLCTVGLVLVSTLFSLYVACIERMIRFETALRCYDVGFGNALDNKGPLLPIELASLPVRQPPSAHFFNWTYLILLGCFILLLMWRAFV